MVAQSPEPGAHVTNNVGVSTKFDKILENYSYIYSKWFDNEMASDVLVALVYVPWDLGVS